MTARGSLTDYLSRTACSAAAAVTVSAVAEAAAKLSRLIARGSLDIDLAAEQGENVQGEVQKRLDVIADREIMAAARAAPIAVVLSEENEEPLVFGAERPIALAIDPLDGSSNIAVNAAIGTIFSLLPAIAGDPEASFRQSGRHQLAAGYIVYGPQTQLALTVGAGTVLFTLDCDAQTFFQTAVPTIASRTTEFAINASNHRHWLEGVRRYVNDCLAGTDGPLGKDYNMRWLAAAVGEAHRILVRGGVFMYLPDQRKGYTEGRLRLMYECNPIAFLVEQAGGAATDGQRPILDIEPQSLHQRCGLCFGAREEVARVASYLAMPAEEVVPLFRTRGLFTAASQR